LIETSDEHLEAGVLRGQLNEVQSDEVVDPEQFWELGQTHGYDVQVSWDTQDTPGSLEVQLSDRARADQVRRAVWQPLDVEKLWGAYANDPLESGFRQQLIPQLREYLKERLPEHMMPSAWMVLKQLPLTSNGKVDRRALPAPQGRPEEMGEYVTPRTQVERILVDIWTQLLRIDQVGVQDNFFELGGHSLLATRVISRIRDLLQVELPLRALFDAQTVEKLSVRVESEEHERAAKERLRTSNLSRDLRQTIDEMRDDAVLARISELERELGHTVRGQSS
jgi:acyl carrier protein